MAPRTRRSTRRLAAINAEYAQDSSAQSAAKQEQLKDDSVAKEPEDSHSVDNEDERVGTDHPAQKPSAPAKPTSSRNKRVVASRDPRAMFGSKSDLTKINLTKFLSDEKTWASLTSEQQAILKAMCPKDSAWGKSSLEQPTLGFLRYDMHWRSDVRVYTENLADGYYDPAWIQEAEKATKKRNDGEFDDWKLKNFEEYWGQKMDPDRKELGKKKQKPAFSDLVAQGILQINDEWFYSRSFGRGKKLVTVGRHFHMTSIDDYGTAQFRLFLPASTTSLKRFVDDMEDEDKDEDRRIPERIKNGKQVKINEVNQAQQQSPIIDSPPASSTKVQEDTAGAGSDPSKTKTIDQNDPTAYGAPSTSAEDQPTKMALPIDVDQASSQPLKPILKKPSMVPFSMPATHVEELEKQLLKHSNYDQDPGKTDAWKYFHIRRGLENIGSLQTLREEYWKKLAS
ncbi:MAG: hypothetical protein GOMPHAMPRED_003845 [Gomphillus americanus]|uniref:ASX DEUBAD domain-containing protein n=1 Tax=Gomphillus americanus TaxID=1940652 RepID=A0A8H3FG05_9LECA|nr:MAG: hypothetical protein GOMPHAMPRED_003845 [Gomphillus americanus]